MVSIQSLVEVKDRLRIRSLSARQCLAEFLAGCAHAPHTGVFGPGCHQWRNQRKLLHRLFLAGSPGVMLAICVSGNVSGAHLNPAFSLPMRLRGHLPWARFLIYSLVQLLSVFCASVVSYALYHSNREQDALHNYTGGSLTVTGPKETASIFATYPAPYLSLSNGFLDQVLGTWMLMVEMAILDTEQGSACRSGACGGGVTDPGHHTIHGANCGLPINPAQDLGPQLFAYIAGWGHEVFGAGNGWWRVPVVGPLVGAMLGTATSQLQVAQHHSEDSEPSQDLECAQQEALGSGSPAATQLQESKLRL